MYGRYANNIITKNMAGTSVNVPPHENKISVPFIQLKIGQFSPDLIKLTRQHFQTLTKMINDTETV
jgi:hypothetical protein